MECSYSSVGFSVSAVLLIVIIVILKFKKEIIEFKDAIIEKLKQSSPYKIETKYGTIYLRQAAEYKAIMGGESEGISMEVTKLKYPEELITAKPPENADAVLPSINAIITKNLEEQNIKTNKRKLEHLVDELSVMQLKFMLLAIDSLIYESQIKILYFLETNKNVTLDLLKPIYDDVYKKFPSYFDKYPFEQNFLGWMKEVALIVEKDNRYRLSGVGELYLSYLQKGSPKRFRPF